MTEENLKLPQDRSPALRVMAQPSDANVHGDVFGGWIMANVDIAGSIPAVQRAGGRVATIAVNSFVFKQPVFQSEAWHQIGTYGAEKPPDSELAKANSLA